MKYGLLILTDEYKKNDHNIKIYKCLCDCGGVKWSTKSHLKSGHDKTCGCQRRKPNMDKSEMLEWILKNTDKDGDCLVWNGPKHKVGYGSIGYEGETRYSHRLTWFLNFGKIPKGLQVLHKCDNRLCVNVNHLFLGTNQDNVDDKVNKGRQLKGENISGSKLTKDDVDEIRRRYKRGGIITQQNLADEFGVTRHLIGKVVSYKRWNWD